MVVTVIMFLVKTVPDYAPGRILAVVGAENVVKLRTVLIKSDRAVKELLCCDGEELKNRYISPSDFSIVALIFHPIKGKSESKLSDG